MVADLASGIKKANVHQASNCGGATCDGATGSPKHFLQCHQAALLVPKRELDLQTSPTCDEDIRLKTHHATTQQNGQCGNSVFLCPGGSENKIQFRFNLKKLKKMLCALLEVYKKHTNEDT